jgi:hypothetical protein
MLAIKKSCNNESWSWSCRSAGKHNPNTMQVCVGSDLCGNVLVRVCQDQIDNARVYNWKTLIPMENR